MTLHSSEFFTRLIILVRFLSWEVGKYVRIHAFFSFEYRRKIQEERNIKHSTRKMIYTKREIVQVYRSMNDVLSDWFPFFFFFFFFFFYFNPHFTIAAILPFSFSNFPLFSVGYRVKVDSRSIVRVNQKVLQEEIAKKKEEYLNNAEILQICKHCEMEKVSF